MLKALVIKELRESAGILAVAVLAALYVLAAMIGVQLFPLWTGAWNGIGIPFVSDGFTTPLLLVTGCLAIALGLKQSAWETGHGTYYFLFHRPVSRKVLFATKLATGATIVLAIGSVLVMLYGLWAATPGKSATPFAWSMTMWAWQLVLAMAVVYLGAFLSGIRPARWFGTRLVPLVAAAVLAIPLYAATWWYSLAGLSLCVGLLVVSILYYAIEHDY